MRILHILGTDRLSGAENVHLGILRALKDKNEVIYASPDGPIREAVEEAGVRFIPCDTESPRKIRKLCDEIHPDIVHACDPRMSFKCALAGVHFTSHLHNNCPWMKKINTNSLALRYAAKKADDVIVVSRSVSDDYVFNKAFSGKLHVIPNTVDAQKVKRMANEPFDTEYNLLFVGRLTDQKRPILFLSLVKELTASYPALRAAMVGEGEMLGDVDKYIKENNIENVDVLGFQTNPYKIMAHSRIVVFTSYYEGFGLVAVEGMILGKPPVAYPAGGITEIARCGGFVCESPEEMKKTVLELLNDDAKYSEASRRAKSSSHQYTDIDNYISEIYKIYKSKEKS